MINPKTLTKAKSMKRNTPLIFAALCLALAMQGCGKNDTASNAGDTSGQPEKKLKLAFVSNNAASFWTIARAGTAEAQKELGDVEVDFRIPATATAAEQQQVLD